MTKVEWNQVTSLSKLLALLLFIALPILGFFLGKWYQQQITFNVVPAADSSYVANHMAKPVVSVGQTTIPDTPPPPPGAVPGDVPVATGDVSDQQASVPLPPAPVPGKNPTVPVTTGGEVGF